MDEIASGESETLPNFAGLLHDARSIWMQADQ